MWGGVIKKRITKSRREGSGARPLEPKMAFASCLQLAPQHVVHVLMELLGGGDFALVLDLENAA